MYRVFLRAAILAIAAIPLCLAASGSKQKAAGSTAKAKIPRGHKQPSKQATTTRSGVKSTSSKSKTSSKSSGTKTRRSRYAKRAPRPSYQLHPDQNRYQEIQKALASRGYYKGETNGLWDSDSVNALKRFQVDQKREPDGKIDARSLIDLGLGPKHDGSSAKTVPGVGSTPTNIPPPPVAVPPPSSEALPADPSATTPPGSK